MFQLNVSVFIRAKDEDRNIQSKCRQGFLISKLVSENSIFFSISVFTLAAITFFNCHWENVTPCMCVC